ncbi:20232_t:CDS:2 [Gigaspora rosea]|nr:20232_t:CDS:2 [Gigaspora rosea]
MARSLTAISAKANLTISSAIIILCVNTWLETAIQKEIERVNAISTTSAPNFGKGPGHKLDATKNERAPSKPHPTSFV